MRYKLRDFIYEVHVPEYLEEKVGKESMGAYLRTFRDTPNLLLNRWVDKITEEDMQKYFDSLSQKCAPKTLRQKEYTFQGMFNHAIRMGLITDNPCRNISKPLGQDIEPYSSSDVKRIKAVLPYYPLDDLFLTPLLTSLSRQQYLGLKYEDISVNQNVVTIRRHMKILKGGRFTAEQLDDPYEVEVSEEAIFHLRNTVKKQQESRYPNEERWLFTDWKGRMLTRDKIKVATDMLREATEINDLSLKTLRTFGCRGSGT